MNRFEQATFKQQCITIRLWLLDELTKEPTNSKFRECINALDVIINRIDGLLN